MSIYGIFFQTSTPACRNNLCGQGEHKCPTPQACVLPEEDGEPRRQRMPEGGAFALLLVVAIAASTIGLHFLAQVLK